MAITERTRILQLCSVLIMLMAQLLSSSPVASGYGTSLSPLSLSSVSYVMSRSEAYYMTEIPASGGPNLLGFNWNVSASYPVTGQGSIQFSHDNSTWSNLASYYMVLGEAQGRQPIDSSWATPGTNYLRASYNQSSSEVLSLKIFVNYAVTVLVFLSPFVAIGTIGAGIYFVRKSHRQSNALTA